MKHDKPEEINENQNEPQQIHKNEQNYQKWTKSIKLNTPTKNEQNSTG